ncbi:MAG: glycosyltransferase [Desulforhabdus sp.]|jgi:predicted glycosyltransferase|nr:glycosyltransferase [Desulforhabdus sp.]
MKIMQYCQHVLGVGHFFRSMAIAAAFDRHHVLFVEGGEPLPGFIPPSHVERVFLTPLVMDSEFSRVEARQGNIDEIKAQRRSLLAETFRSYAPDVLIVELFPFGRKFFQFELLPLLQAIRQEQTTVKVVCSLRDILVEKKDQTSYEKRVLNILNSYFDLLVIHSDPALAPLDETFYRIDQIRIPIEYTGFVVRRIPSAAAKRTAGLIVASGGGSRVGTDLLAATIRAVQILPGKEMKLRAFTSPFAEKDEQLELADLAAQDQRTRLFPFTPDFLNELAGAELSISMAGYNTCMDILTTGVSALVYPFPQNREQTMRAQKLHQLGVLEVLESLQIEYLAAAISARLEKTGPSPNIDSILTEGAANTVRVVEKYFGKP